jgi:hypothetical protein
VIELADRRPYQPRDLTLIFHVGRHRDASLSGRFLDRCRRLLKVLKGARCDDEVSSMLGEEVSCGGADTRSATCDDRDFARDVKQVVQGNKPFVPGILGPALSRSVPFVAAIGVAPQSRATMSPSPAASATK